MVDKIEMSLDDIIKSNKTGFGNRRNNRGGAPRGNQQNRRRGGASGGAPGFRNRNSEGVKKGNARGGITRSKYTRVRHGSEEIHFFNMLR